MAEPDADTRQSLESSGDTQLFASLDEMLSRGAVDAVYVATPTPLHAEHVIRIAEAGRHVLVEKPMATNLDESRAMIAAAQSAGVTLMVGHSHAYDPPILRMRDLIAGGRWGPVRMLHSWCYTDWIYRPRRPDELQSEQGGGVTFRQGAHQFDILRLLGGGIVSNVRAAVGSWDPARPGIGAHTAFLQFADGAAATAVYSGYGAFSTAELAFGIGESGWPEAVDEMGHRRRAFRARAPGDELAAKRARVSRAPAGMPPFQPFFGIHIVSCDGGDVRQSPNGVYVYDENGRTDIAVEDTGNGRDVMLADFIAAIRSGRPPRHDGLWGQATLETCLAVLRSSTERREVPLRLQTPVRE